MPRADRGDVRTWTSALFDQNSPPAQAHHAGANLLGYLQRLVEKKRASDDDDLTTALVHAHADEDRLSRREPVDSLGLLLIAGHETAVSLIGSAVVNLLGHPGQLATVISEIRWDDAAEETLRLNPPVTGAFFRYARTDVEIAGVTIRAGEPVYLCCGGAATDPDEYGDDADRFDVERAHRSHLAIGHGPHFCLGAPLARLEGQVALSRLFARFPDLRLAAGSGDVPYSPSFLVRGPVSLAVTQR